MGIDIKGSSSEVVHGNAVVDEGSTGVSEYSDDDDLLPLLLLLVRVLSTMLLRNNRALPSETVSIRIVTLSRLPSPSVLSDIVVIKGGHLAITAAFLFARADGDSSSSIILEPFLPPLLPTKNCRRTASVQSVATNG